MISDSRSYVLATYFLPSQLVQFSSKLTALGERAAGICNTEDINKRDEQLSGLLVEFRKSKECLECLGRTFAEMFQRPGDKSTTFFGVRAVMQNAVSAAAWKKGCCPSIEGSEIRLYNYVGSTRECFQHIVASFRPAAVRISLSVLGAFIRFVNPEVAPTFDETGMPKQEIGSPWYVAGYLAREIAADLTWQNGEIQLSVENLDKIGPP